MMLCKMFVTIHFHSTFSIQWKLLVSKALHLLYRNTFYTGLQLLEAEKMFILGWTKSNCLWFWGYEISSGAVSWCLAVEGILRSKTYLCTTRWGSSPPSKTILWYTSTPGLTTAIKTTLHYIILHLCLKATHTFNVTPTGCNELNPNR